MTPAEHYAQVQQLADEASAIPRPLDTAGRERVVALAQLGHLHLELARHADLAEPVTSLRCGDEHHPDVATTVWCAAAPGHPPDLARRTRGHHSTDGWDRW